MDHRLLVTGQVVTNQIRILLKRLPDTGDVTVTENAENARKEPVLYPIALNVLVGKKLD